MPEILPAGTYSFQKEDFYTVRGLQTVIVRPDIAEEVVYKLTKMAWVHWDEVIKATAAAKWVKPADILSMTSPVHPGAVRYYREIGIEIPERLIWKKR